jgi:hypothetical protein
VVGSAADNGAADCNPLALTAGQLRRLALQQLANFKHA